MSTPGLAERVSSLPKLPGVYLFRDAQGQVLYVGKAINLRARVRQYFQRQDERPMVRFLLRDAHDVDVVLVETEKEALLLENTLIKTHQPRYNAKLKDDKNFLHLRIRRDDPWPRFTMVRRIQQDGATFFGPYHSAAAARKTLTTVQRSFPLRSCSDRVLASRTRPCLLHQMHRCGAPCAGLTTREEYLKLVDEASLFLSGRNQEVLQRLKGRMDRAALEERFEDAARLRDLIRAIQTTIQRQVVVDRRLGDRDVWGLYREAERGVVAILPVREGLLQEPVLRTFTDAGEEDDALITTLVLHYYDVAMPGSSPVIPDEVLLPFSSHTHESLADILQERRGRRVRVHVPQKGEKRRLILMATQNARERFQRTTDSDEQRRRSLAALARICHLPRAPERIECYDNSNLQGSDPVASMVVFIQGRPTHKEYRRFRVKSVEGPDDYATMREILGRRFQHQEAHPDLVVVDGGRGQVQAVRAVLEELGLPRQTVIGLAKPRSERTRGERSAVDKIILPEARDPIRLRPNDPALRLLQHLRDESHRYAVRYHRKLRSKRNLTSLVQELPGVGPARSKKLLAYFGSARRLASASSEEISQVPGIGPKLAPQIHRALRGEDPAGDAG